MFLREILARFLMLKGSALGCMGSVYWLIGQPEAGAVLIALAMGYVGAAWFVDRRMG